jgi:Apea-like HEPN
MPNDLYNALKELVERSYALLSQSFDQFIPPYNGKKYQEYFSNYKGYIMNPHLYTDKPLSQRLYENLLNKHKNQIEQLPEFKNVLKLMTSSNFFKYSDKLNSLWGTSYNEPFSYVSPSIWKLIKSNYEQSSFDEEQFEQEYDKINHFLNGEQLPIVEIQVPLYNLKCNQDSVDLSLITGKIGKMILRKITDDEKASMISVIGGYQSDTVVAIQYSEFMLEVEYYENYWGRGEYPHEKIISIITEFVTALRLIRTGYVGTPLILFRAPLIDNVVILPFDYDLFSLLPNIKEGKIVSMNLYTFDQNDIFILVHILQLLRGIHNKNKDIAVKRFNSAYVEKEKVDKIIDWMIAYETLFSKPNDSTDSVTYKLALRFSKLLAKDAKNRDCYFHQMTELYGLRSRLVHGREEDVDNKSLSLLEEYIRSSIFNYLCEMDDNSFGDNHLKFIEYLDFYL